MVSTQLVVPYVVPLCTNRFTMRLCRFPGLLELIAADGFTEFLLGVRS